MSEHTPVPSTTKEEFELRVNLFSKASKVPVDDVIKILNELGVDGDSDDCIEMLDNDQVVTVPDLFRKFVDDHKVPIARVRFGIPHLRGKTDTEVPKETLPGGTETDLLKLVKQVIDTNKSVESMTDQELLSLYDTGRPEVIDRLARLSRGRPCIVLNADGTVNVTESTKLLRIAAKGMPTTSKHRVGNRTVKVYIPGKEFNVKPMDESPIYQGKILIDDFCAESNTDWKGVSYEARVMVRIYVREVETSKLSKMQMKQLSEDAKKGFEYMYENYSEAASIYDDLKELGRLPSLKVAHSDSQATSNVSKDKGFI